MMSLENFHFLRPAWLLLLPLLGLVLWLMIKRRLGNRSWEAVCDQHLLPFMLIGGSSQSRRLSLSLIAVCGTLAIVSLAGPVWEKLPQPVFNRQSALVIAMDLSRSMDANDITPSRLTRARFKVTDILNQHGEGQIALLVYAADAYTVSPLTDDVETIKSQLPALTTSIMPSQGNNTAAALERAEALLKGAGHASGNVLLVTDEVDLESAGPIAMAMADRAYRTFVLGVGTRHGAPVVNDDGSFLKDKEGEIVIPVLEETAMRQLAQQGNGAYRRMSSDDRDIDFLMKNIGSGRGAEQEAATEFETDTWREQGPWLLLALLPLSALAFRRGYIAVFFLVFLPLPRDASAIDWKSLWLRDDQRAIREFAAGNTEKAAELFSDPGWRAAAEYRSGNFQSTLESLEGLEDVESIYNSGNALARLGEYQRAIERYDAVLKLDPDHEDARHNRELLEEELKKQQQKQQSGQDQQQNEDQQNPQEGEDNQQQAGQDGKQDSGGEQDQQESGQDGNGDQQEPGDAGQDQNEQDAEPPVEQDNNQGQEEQADTEQERARSGQQSGEEEEEQQSQMSRAQADESGEEQQATEQWLRRIPDDPAGLLRRKFRYQYQQRQRRENSEEKTW